MKEVIRMWKYPVMVALTVLTAAVYTAVLVPFKAIPLIPGYTEIRPANLVPVVSGLMFGPAGAWGSAIGNLAGDFFGTLSIGSIFGFIGNFIFAYLPYKLWGKVGIFAEKNNAPTVDSPRKLAEFGFASLIGSAACSLVIAWGLDGLKLVPFEKFASIVLLNNAVINLLTGPILLPVIYRQLKKRNLIWTEIMERKDIHHHPYPRPYITMVLIGALGGILTGLALSFGTSTAGIPILLSNPIGNLYIEIAVLPFLIMMFYGASRL